MITTQERTGTMALMGNTMRMELPGSGRHKLMGDFIRGFTLMWNRHVPFHVKLVSLALAVGITACVLAFEVPVEALILAVLSKSGFIGVMAFVGVQALAGPVILSCLLLPSLAPTAGGKERGDRF